MCSGWNHSIQSVPCSIWKADCSVKDAAGVVCGQPATHLMTYSCLSGQRTARVVTMRQELCAHHARALATFHGLIGACPDCGTEMVLVVPSTSSVSRALSMCPSCHPVTVTYGRRVL